MKKLKEIPFNHELIGKEGIVIKYLNGEKVVDIYHFKQTTNVYCIISTDEKENLWVHRITGQYAGLENSLDLIMYQEIEVKEPKQIFVVETLNGEIVCTLRTIEEAENIVHYLAPPNNYKYKITKFIEVIEEGE